MTKISNDAKDLWLLELGRAIPDAVRHTERFELEGVTAAFSTKDELEHFANRYGYEGNCWHLTKHEISEAPVASGVPDEVVRGNSNE